MKKHGYRRVGGHSVAGLLLAAGEGRRYGLPKALVNDGGQLLVERGLATMLEANCSPVVVVLGAAVEEIQMRAKLDGALVVVNEAWRTGMGSSLRVGLTALAGSRALSTIVLLVDMPSVTAAAVRRVLDFDAPSALVSASYGGRPGHPVLLGREHWAQVAELARGDVGARPYLQAHQDRLILVPCDDVADPRDIDLPQE